MTFIVYTDISIVNTNDIVLYIDECLNVANLYCDSPDNHDYVLTYNNTEFTFKEVVREGETKEVTTSYTYELSAKSNIITELDKNIKYIKMFCTTEDYANDQRMVYIMILIYYIMLKLVCYTSIVTLAQTISRCS